MKRGPQPILGVVLFLIGVLLLIGNIQHRTRCQWVGITMSLVVMFAGIRLCSIKDNGERL